MMDVSQTIIPKSDQLNFEDVQSRSITAVVVAVRRGNSEQPVQIHLEGYDGKPYKPSKTMRKILVEGWGCDGHSWVGRSLTLYGDPSVKFGGVAVGGIKIKAMSHIEATFSLMLATAKGRRSEFRVEKLDVEIKAASHQEKITDPQAILTWFSDNAIKADLASLEATYGRAKVALAAHPEHEKKLNEVYSTRKKELEGNVQA